MEEEWIECELIDQEDLPNFGNAPKQPMSINTKIHLFRMVLSMPDGFRRIAESIKNAVNSEDALKACHTIIELVEEDAKQEVARARADLDKYDAKLLKMALEKVMSNL